MTLEEVEKILTGTPKEVFPDEKSEEKFKQIKIACHPDKNPGSKLAEDLFKKASKYWEDSKIQQPQLSLLVQFD